MRGRLAIVGMALGLTLGVAAAAVAASTPLPNKTYNSSSPNVSITMRSATEIYQLYASCSASGQVAQSFTATNVPLVHDGFTIDGKERLNTPTGGYNNSVLFTGTFAGGAFHGTVALGGSSCAKATYTAKALKGGPGGANAG